MANWSAVFVGRSSGFGVIQVKILASTSIDAEFFVGRLTASLCGALASVALLKCVVLNHSMVICDLGILPSVVVRRLFRNASLVGYPRFFVSQARVFVVLGVLSRYLCCTVEVCVVFLDTLTPEFELYVRLRERRQWGSDFPEFVLLSLVLRPETLEVPGMGLQLCVCRSRFDLFEVCPGVGTVVTEL
ncbi:hypothetical protein Taro_002867 [Colocasia esculenta]|uniref:Uncharacterized protein n=1 Tax=Colocasia esculenta TaxID=4460 RepID=A0A843TM72_COLES|nr:hypothetical protein [Colocasia esculenta]